VDADDTVVPTLARSFSRRKFRLFSRVIVGSCGRCSKVILIYCLHVPLDIIIIIVVVIDGVMSSSARRKRR